jgi:hypothetical protein
MELLINNTCCCFIGTQDEILCRLVRKSIQAPADETRHKATLELTQFVKNSPSMNATAKPDSIMLLQGITQIPKGGLPAATL